MIDSMLANGRDFDLAHAYLALFMKVSQSELSPQLFIVKIFPEFPVCHQVLFCFSASPPLAVAGLCCHGSIAPPLLPSGGRVDGATVIIRPITVSAVIRQERPAVTVFLLCTLLNVDDEC